jgi:hypothetical protein
MLLVGVNPQKYTLQSADNPLIIQELEKLGNSSTSFSNNAELEE